jgi:hypothetical protein
MCGCIAAGKTAVLRLLGHSEDRWPDVAPAIRVVQAPSESACSRKRSSFGDWPDRAGGRCVNTRSRLALVVFSYSSYHLFQLSLNDKKRSFGCK